MACQDRERVNELNGVMEIRSDARDVVRSPFRSFQTKQQLMMIAEARLCL